MKAYTDLKQSRKLAKILPIESADMVFTFSIKEDTCVPDKYPSCRKYSELYKEFVSLGFSKEHIGNLIYPCWSLAALFDVLPKGVIENYYAPNLQKENGKYSIAYGDEELLCIADNPIDACYEMILKLYELKML